MKLNVKLLIIFAIFFIMSAVTASAQVKKDFIGKWNTYAPDAPDENQKSTIIIKQDSLFITFDGINLMPANSMEFKNDTLKCEISGVTLSLEFESKNKLKGMAFWSNGQSALQLTRIEDPAQGNKQEK